MTPDLEEEEEGATCAQAPPDVVKICCSGWMVIKLAVKAQPKRQVLSCKLLTLTAASWQGPCKVAVTYDRPVTEAVCASLWMEQSD
jgi:hypothetical protein